MAMPDWQIASIIGDYIRENIDANPASADSDIAIANELLDIVRAAAQEYVHRPVFTELLNCLTDTQIAIRDKFTPIK